MSSGLDQAHFFGTRTKVATNLAGGPSTKPSVLRRRHRRFDLRAFGGRLGDGLAHGAAAIQGSTTKTRTKKSSTQRCWHDIDVRSTRGCAAPPLVITHRVARRSIVRAFQGCPSHRRSSRSPKGCRHPPKAMAEKKRKRDDMGRETEPAAEAYRPDIRAFASTHMDHSPSAT